MRVLICDDHVVFAESLGHLLGSMGIDVVAVTYTVNQALAGLRRDPVEICLLDVMFGSESAMSRLAELRDAAPEIKIVLLSGQVDASLLAAARSSDVSAVADKREPIADIVALLERVQSGRVLVPAVPRAEPSRRASRRPAGHPQELAAFLTPRERQVVSALVCGTDTVKIARSLGIAEVTARCHIQSALTKMGAHSRLEVATTVVRCGMVNPETGEWLMPAR